MTIGSLRRWYRDMIAATYTAKKRGRPPLTREQIELIQQLAEENPTWGEDTIAHRMGELGHDVSDRAVGNWLKKLGIPPAPERSQQNDWFQFIADNFAHTVAIDCTTWEAPTPDGKRTIRHHACYAIRLATREVRLLGMTNCANGTWMTNCIRELTTMFDNTFMDEVQHIIMDNDPMYIKPVKKCLNAINCTMNYTKPNAPWMNADIERFISTTRKDLRGRFIPVSTESLRYALQKHVDYYNTERTHQSTPNNRPPVITHDIFSPSDGVVKRRQHLGNMLNSYYREGA